MPENLTLLGLTFLYADVSTLYEGDKTVSPIDEEKLEAFITTFQLRHTFGQGFSMELDVPIGSLRFEGGEDSTVSRANGLGDIAMGVRYDLWALWGAGGYNPSVVIHSKLGLPTGKLLKTSEATEAGLLTSNPQLLPLGLGAYSATIGLDYTQYIHKRIAIRMPFWAKFPMHANTSGMKQGNSYGYGMGILTQPGAGFVVAAGIDGLVRQRSSEAEKGTVLQSGGHWLNATLDVGYRINERFFLAARGEMPVYANVNGQQLSETFRVMGSVTVSFGADPTKTHDCAHEGPGDHHHHYDEEGTDLGPHTDDAVGHDHHGEHNQAKHVHESTEKKDCSKKKDAQKKGCGGDCKTGCCKKQDAQKKGCENDCKKDCNKKENAQKKACGGDCKTGCCKKKDAQKKGCGDGCKSDCCKKKEASKKDCASDCKKDCNKQPTADIANAATGGRSFAIKDVLVPGKVTVIDYWAEWCVPCKEITTLLTELASKHPNLAIRKVEVPNFDAPVVKEHIPNVPKIPVLWVYNSDGERVGTHIAPDIQFLRKAILKQLQ